MYVGLALLALTVAGVILMVFLLVAPRSDDPVASRVEGLRAQPAGAATTMYTPAGLVVLPSAPDEAQVQAARRQRQQQGKLSLRDRLMQAGLYRSYSPATYALARFVLAICPLGLGVLLGLAGVVPLLPAILLGAAVAGIGTIAPSFWLDHLKSSRQKQLRRALPDALDVIGVCLEGGLSLSGAFSRVGQELMSAHPLLATELRIVEREVQMGRSMGEAVRQFAKRFDMEELRSLAAVINQSEKFGTSVVKALGVYGDTMRRQRYQRAETLAQQASIKMIFPTLFCIFPAIFVVILGPAAIRIYLTFIVEKVGQ